MHLSPEEFVDVAEGTRTEASLPHLAECEQCRRGLAALRSALGAAVEAEVPEPSPLFWDSLSARVAERIDAEAGRPAWLAQWRAWLRPSILVPVSTLAVLLLVIALAPQWRGTRPLTSSSTTSVSPGAAATTVDPGNDLDLDADPLLTLVSDLSATMDLDSVSDAGLTDSDSAEHAVTVMSTDELSALKQVIQAEMTRSGA